MNQYICYLIALRNWTYVGITNNLQRRLRQHNNELRGGAKYTTRKGSGWEVVCCVTGFNTKQEVLRFEWDVKHRKLSLPLPLCNENKILLLLSTAARRRVKRINALLNHDRWLAHAPQLLIITQPHLIAGQQHGTVQKPSPPLAVFAEREFP